MCNYYPGEPIDDAEVEAVQKVAEQQGIDVLNTRYVASFINHPRMVEGIQQCEGLRKQARAALYST